MSRPLALALAAFLLTGCAGPPVDTMADRTVGAWFSTSASTLATVLDHMRSGHTHSDPQLHHAYGWDLEETFHSNLPLGAPPRSVGQFELHEDLAFISVNAGGFLVLDVSDPAKPTQIAQHIDPALGFTNDIAISPDGRFAFLSNEASAIALAFAPPDQKAEAMGGGLLVFDISTPSSPRPVYHHRAPEFAGYHRVTTATIGGDLYLVTATYVQGGCVDVLRFVPAPSPVLVPTTRIVCGGAHEVFVAPDPLTARPVAVIAMWEEGVMLVDLSDPGAPKALGTWTDLPPIGDRQGNAHEAQIFGVDGRRIVAVAGEYGSAATDGSLWLVDFTDAARPQLVGAWDLPGTNPFSIRDEGLQSMTTDAPVVVNGRIWLTHHHAGLYVLNVSTMEKVRAPELEAWIMPSPASELGRFGRWLATPMVYDVVPRGRDVFVTDITGGLRVFAWDPGAGLWWRETPEGPPAVGPSS